MLISAGLFLALLVTSSSLAYAVNTIGVRRQAYFVAVPLWDLAQISRRIDELIVPDVAITGKGLDLPHFGRTGDRARRSIFGAQRIASIAGFHHPFKFSERPGYSILRQIFNSSAESVLCRPSIYMAIAICVWLYGRWRRSEESLIAGSFASSGLLSVLPLFVIAPSTDFRYAVWLVASALVSVALSVSFEVRARRPARSGSRKELVPVR